MCVASARRRSRSRSARRPLVAVGELLLLELLSRDSVVACCVSFGAPRFQQGRPLAVRLQLRNVTGAPVPWDRSLCRVARPGAGLLPAGAERCFQLEVAARLLELGSVVWLESVALDLAAPGCLPVTLH